MSLNANTKPLVKDLINLQRKLAPLEAQKKALVEQVRAALPAGTYDIPNVGIVKISAASEAKLKGTQYVVTEKFAELSPKERTKLQDIGAIKLENIFSQARSASVTVTPL